MPPAAVSACGYDTPTCAAESDAGVNVIVGVCTVSVNAWPSVNGPEPPLVLPLESVADISANAIQNAHYFEKVRQMAYVDGLTGMFNRRFFEIRIMEELERAQRYHGSMSVIMLDIDKFKKLNDEFGHLLGGEVLRQVSAIFSAQLRKADVACR